MKKTKKYPEGHFVGMWMALGIAIFSGIGIPLSIATENYAFMGIGPALGVAFGMSIGTGIEAKMKKQGKIRPLTKEEAKKKRGGVAIGIIALLILVVLALIMFFIVSG